MDDNYKELSIREVIKQLPLDEMVDVLKAKGLTSEEIKMLLELEKKEILRNFANESQDNVRCR